MVVKAPFVVKTMKCNTSLPDAEAPPDGLSGERIGLMTWCL